MQTQSTIRRRGFTLVELLVVIAIISVLAVIIVPNIIGTGQHANQTRDASQMRQLVQMYTASSADKRTPRATGHRFWIALCTGDGADTRGGLRVDGVEDTRGYLPLGDAATLLRSPADGWVLDSSETRNRLEAALADGTGVPADSEMLTSYAGPVSSRAFSSRAQPIVACTCARNGYSLYSDCFIAVYANGVSETLYFSGMVESHDWAEGTTEPLYGSAPLEHVIWEPAAE